jgi:hypothetical protein
MSRAYLIEIAGKPPAFRTVAADAKREAREAGGNMTELEIPDTKRDLIPWLNEFLEQRGIDEAADRRHHDDPLGLELEREDHVGDAAAYSRGPIAGAVITEAELAKVNATRPAFLGRLTAEEIERRRMATNDCPKCGNSRSYLHSLERLEVESWILDRATPHDLAAIAALIEENRQ